MTRDTDRTPPDQPPNGSATVIVKGHSLDLIETLDEAPDLIATDPPYAFGGSGDEHAISATVATVLRESARRLKRDRWMVVMCASSWRSASYMVEAVRGIVEPVRIGAWCKPAARTRVKTGGWDWATVNAIVFKKGRPAKPHPAYSDKPMLDHITKAPVINGRRAELPIPRIALENPIGVLSTRSDLGKPTQIIQPWMFGHGETKATCLWLKNLPKLWATHRKDDLFASKEPTERVGRVHREPPGPDRWKNRSRTYPGIAEAMAEQWGEISQEGDRVR